MRRRQNGSFTVTGLKAGYYICEELASDSGHVIDTAPQSFYICGKDQDVVTNSTSGNSPKGSRAGQEGLQRGRQLPLSDVEFLVTDSYGAVVGDANGKFVTDSTGSFLVEGSSLGPPWSSRRHVPSRAICWIIRPRPPVKDGQTVTWSSATSLWGISSSTNCPARTRPPLEGVQFKITYADGSYLPDAENGKLSSNGLM